jgi:hypothetical protein
MICKIIYGTLQLRQTKIHKDANYNNTSSEIRYIKLINKHINRKPNLSDLADQLISL